MIRVICCEVDSADVAYSCGSAKTTYRTFDVDLPELENWLSEHRGRCERSFVGLEIISVGERYID